MESQGCEGPDASWDFDPAAADDAMEGAMMMDDSFGDAQEELDFLQLGLQHEAQEAVAGMVRAMFSLGASPVEAKAVMAEICSPHPSG